MNNNHSQNEIDPRLKAMFDAAQDVPARDPEVVARGRARFVADVDAVPVYVPQPANKVSGWQQFKSWLAATQSHSRQRAALTTLVAVVMIVAFLFGGAGITAYAAQSALPGDALYGVKTGLEQTQASLASDAARKVELYLRFAERRLDEIARLIDEGRYDDIQLATSEYQAYVQFALEAMKDVAAGNPVKATELAGRITALLTRYSQVLSGMMGNVPDAARTSLEEAIQFSESEGSAQFGQGSEMEFVGIVEQMGNTVWVIGGKSVVVTQATEIKGQIVIGSLVKVHANSSADGSLIAREIELTDGLPGNENANTNGNENGNSNTNDDNNGNANDDDNTNDDNDDHGNDNGNENDNDSNSNDDSNDNSNGDGSNMNDDDNQNDDNSNSDDDDSSNSNGGDDSGKDDDDDKP